jgi:hypothetical protein
MKVEVQAIIETVAQHFDLPAEAILGRRRTRNVAYPRQVAMYAVERFRPDLTLQSIATQFDRHHVTVMWACRQVKKRMAADEGYARTIRGIMATVGEQPPHFIRVPVAPVPLFQPKKPKARGPYKPRPFKPAPSPHDRFAEAMAGRSYA